MNRLPTKVAEDIYYILQRYAEASPVYYDREGFIYSFAVIPNPPNRFDLTCMDDKSRTFVKNGDVYTLEGKGDSKVNTIIKKIISDNILTTPDVDGFKIREV